MMIDVVGLEQINIEHGRAAGDEVLRHVARIIRFEIHAPDILFRYRGDEFVALLHSIDAGGAEALGRKIVENVHEHPPKLRSGMVINIDIATTSVSAPQDGPSLHDLLTIARATVPARSQPLTVSRVH